MARLLLHRTLPLFGIAALGFVLSGCAGHTPPVPPFYDSPDAALRALAATPPGKQAFTSTARIEINHQGDRYPLKVAVMMKRPAFLRLESIPLMGPPDLFLSVAEGELRVFLPGKAAFYIGRATPRNISRFLPVFMPAADMISLLMGVPPEDAEETQSLGGEQEKGLYRVISTRREGGCVPCGSVRRAAGSPGSGGSGKMELFFIRLISRIISASGRVSCRNR